jgi:hypothetical protein
MKDRQFQISEGSVFKPLKSSGQKATAKTTIGLHNKYDYIAIYNTMSLTRRLII